MKRSTATALVAILLPAFISACGGGGGGGNQVSATPSPPPPPPPAAAAEGVFGGELIGSTSSEFQVLILENGDVWSLYGQDNGSIFYVDGFVQGNGTWSGESFTSNNVKDFGFYPAISGTLASTYSGATKTISGTVTNSLGSVQFSGSPIPDSLYDYDTAASLGAIAGHWDTLGTSGGSISVDITASGVLTVSEGGCSGSGSIAPRPSGKNVFNVTLTFGLAPCVLPNQTVTGVAIVYPLTTGQDQLIGAMTDSARTVGIAVFGIR
ncbi:hypothetical protein ACG33_12766 [Steroidobacter denitrificans]|uniref:Transferrin-binding protein B C-lobe/N-lobe beta barrel domain-containing protein n=1 Tax=Steroidobacter denitrificans TaxID=465721 RepID=A0A127FC41_STEDE|nr:hypothetical protein [Steroidobacter denitrificans]AMN47953.1 hypothetical protein ACG33_12766 [Steroidobacter denitrificans]